MKKTFKLLSDFIIIEYTLYKLLNVYGQSTYKNLSCSSFRSK